MIPPEIDDGFTVDVGFCCYRPMLCADKQSVLREVTANPAACLRSVLRPPFVFGLDAERVDRYLANLPEEQDHQISHLLLSVFRQTREQEADAWGRLFDTVRLQISKPRLSELSCDTCRRYSVDHSSGELYYSASGDRVDLPLGTPVPCQTRQGCDKGSYANPIGLSVEQFAKTWRHWWRYGANTPKLLQRCSTFARNSMTINWVVHYGGDRRFNPFAPADSRPAARDSARAFAGAVGSDTIG